MSNDVKVLIGEINGQELDQQEEYDLKVRDLSDNNLDAIADGQVPTWDDATQKFIPGDGGSSGSGIVKFGSNSNSGTGKWLEIHRNIVSNEVPYNVASPVNLIQLTVSMKKLTTVTFGIFKNGTQIETLVVTAAKKGIKTGLTHALVANDELSVKIISGSASDPVLHIILG